MKKQDNKIFSCIESVIDSIMLALFFVLFFVGGYALLDANIIDQGARLDNEIASLAPDSDNSTLDLVALRSINPDIVGWLRINDTNLDYPIVQTIDNSTYLVRDYRKEYNTAGAIFADSRNASTLDDFTIIYGHRVDGHKMFGEVSEFAAKEYFDDHVSGKLYTENGTYSLETIAYAVLNIGTTSVYRLSTNKIGHNDEILQEILASAKQKRDAYQAGSQLLMLSTCDKDSQNYRDVLLLQMTKE